MIFLDSSYIISILFSDDINHQRAKELKKFFTHERMMINNTVLNEVLNCFDKETKCVKQIVKSILNIDKIYFLDNEDYGNAIKLFFYYNQAINFSDCTILETMVKEKVNNIVTFDSDFEKIKGINIIR